MEKSHVWRPVSFMKINWVNRHNEEQELNKFYKKIIQRENKYHIAEESTYIQKKESLKINLDFLHIFSLI